MGASRRHTRETVRLLARASLGWCLVFFVGWQLALSVALDGWLPEIHDLEFEIRLKTLRSRLAENPDRPLLLLIGSSRTLTSYRPELLPPLRTAARTEPLQFNFSHFGAGPLLNLVEVHRILRRGIRPDWIVLELMPPFLSDEGLSILTSRTEARDLPVLRRYLPAGKLYGRYLRSRLLPWYKFRLPLCRHFLPAWAPREPNPEEWAHRVEPLGGSNLRLIESDIERAEAERRTESARRTYFPPLQQFHVSDKADRAVREVLDMARQRGIRVVLLLSPEGSAFRGWYPPAARARLDQYCRDLSQAYQVPVRDARHWLPDEDFIDSHHVLLRGSEKFTRRLAREVLQPLVQGTLTSTCPDH